MSMIYQDSSNFGKQIPIYERYRVLEDATKEVDTTKTFFAGQPVALDTIANGQKLIPVASNVKVYGIAKFQKNTYLDEVTGTSPSGIYGSYRGTVIVKGIIDLLTAMVFTLSDGSTHSTTLVNTTGTMDPMAGLYVDDAATADGNYPLCLTAATAWSNTLVGYILNYDAAAGIVQILLP